MRICDLLKKNSVKTGIKINSKEETSELLDEELEQTNSAKLAL